MPPLPTPHPRRPAATLLAIVLSLAVGCSNPDADPSARSTAATSPAAEIEWFGGTVEEAFAVAAADDKDVFLYWGAEWCPPCHYLKSRLFHDPEFVEATRDFVAVYLDGDTERAQTVGEELGTSGYPTVLLFSPDGTELLRLSADLPVERYTEILNLAILHGGPVEEMLAAALAAPDSEPDAHDPNWFRLLAIHSWGQAESELSEEEMREAFRRLWRETPEGMGLEFERSRFLALYLDSLDPEQPPTGEEREDLLTAVRSLLSSPDLRRGNVMFVVWSSTETLDLLTPEDGEERESLKQAWLIAARAMEDDPTLPVDDRLSALLPALWFADGEADPSPELRDRVRSRITWALETVEDEGEMQAVMSTMAYLLETAGLESEAQQLLVDNLDRTIAPYYFMSWLGSLALDEDRVEEGLAWYRQAYDSSRGRYSRFRWGSIYLRRLLASRPEDIETIEADSREILGELLTFGDAFAGGNWSRLGQLEKAYREWDDEGDRKAVLRDLQRLVTAECDRYADGSEDSAAERCRSFLGEA